MSYDVTRPEVVLPYVEDSYLKVGFDNCELLYN